MMPGKFFRFYIAPLTLAAFLSCTNSAKNGESDLLSESTDSVETDLPIPNDTVLFPMIDTIWNERSLTLEWYQLPPEEKGGIKVSVDEDVVYFESTFDESFVTADHKGLLIKQASGWELSQLFLVNDETFIFSVRNIGMSRSVVYSVHYAEGRINFSEKDAGGQCYYIAYVPEQRTLLWHSSADYIENDTGTIRKRSIWRYAVSDSGFVDKQYTDHTASDVAQTDSCLYPHCWEEQYKLYYTEVLKFLEQQ